MERDPAVHIMASGFHGTLYTGVTSDPLGRVYQHREGVTRGFTTRSKPLARAIDREMVRFASELGL